MLISSQWYTKSEAAPRFSIWYAGLGLGQIIGGVLSYAFQQVQHPSFSGWRIMFVVLGLVTVTVGFVTFFLLPDTPMKAQFLTEAEKVVLLKHVAVNQTGISNKKFKPRQLLEVLLDVQLWLMTLLTILVREQTSTSFSKQSNGTLMLTCDPSIDFDIQRCSHDLLCNSDQPLRLLLTACSSLKHAIRSRLDCQHPSCWLGSPLYLQSLGLARSMLYTWHNWWRSLILRNQE